MIANNTYRNPEGVTAGPWTLQCLDPHRTDGNTYAIRAADNVCLAVVGEVDAASRAANKSVARAMLAAPKMIAALRKALEFIESERESREFAAMTNEYTQEARDVAAIVAEALDSATK